MITQKKYLSLRKRETEPLNDFEKSIFDWYVSTYYDSYGAWYDDEDVLIVHSDFINLENEQKLCHFEILCTQEEADEDIFTQKFCVDTSEYHEWESTYTYYKKRIGDIAESFYPYEHENFSESRNRIFESILQEIEEYEFMKSEIPVTHAEPYKIKISDFVQIVWNYL